MDYIPDESAINVENIEVCMGISSILPEWPARSAICCGDGFLAGVFYSHAHSLCLLQVDTDTYDLLRSLNMANLPGVKQAQVRTLRIPSPVSYLHVR